MPPRRTELEPEILDGPLAYDEARRALDDLDRVNRLLFGVTAARRALEPRLVGRNGEGGHGGNGHPPAPLRVLDLGGGSGRLTAALAARAESRGRPARMVVVDRRLSHLVIGRKARTLRTRGNGSSVPALRVVADADALPFRDGAFDWSFSNLFFHHFGAAANRRILGEMLRAARAGAVVVDLRRARPAAWLARLLFPFLRVGRVALHDGLLSIAQSWTPAEVRELVSGDEGVEVIELRRRFPFRWSLVLVRTPPSPSNPSSPSRGRGTPPPDPRAQS